MRHLWQRIFLYALLLVAVSQLAVILLHRYSMDRDETRRFIADYTRSLAAAIDGGSVAASEGILKVFNRRWERVWIEDESGALLAGAIPDRGRPGKTLGKLLDDGPTMLDTGDADWYVAAMPVTMQEGRGTLYMLFGPPRSPGVRTLFFQGVVFMSVIGVLLAFWISRQVSKPLRTLRDEVMEIAGGNLEGRVTVKGHDEIMDVARAVNHMADSLAKHIRSMRELVANISHEMRSPLARMQVSAAMLEEDVSGNPKATGRLALITEELGHMNRLIGATLLTSKLDLQSAAIPEGSVAFSELCAEVCRRHQPVFPEKKVFFACTIQEGITLPGDETLLTTLVSNLLDNAAKYTRENGSISLRLASGPDGVSLTVENEHEPLPEDMLEHLFEPFYRGGIATGNGVGLGLSLVRKIALLHGGDVTAANAANGIRFTVCFPSPGSSGR